ncbi:hypothetical protein SteCoe_24342 [Stentor coeruleus]|uniref:Membrane transporter protein n=1 Tax=Stentor coeruleus TaxID=5963 RepID=A0A1R2BHR4_9CILI|nr:hypothetical protein SteCoe_24342 [Stentor coeruleus]
MKLWLYFLVLSLILVSGSVDSQGNTLEVETVEVPLSNEIGSYIIIFFITALANSAGIGGGPLTICVLLYLMYYENTHALAVSQATILGGSLVASTIKMSFKHPYKGGPLIDYNLVAFISGCLVAGSSTGSLLTRIAQGWMTLLGLSILLWIISYVTLTKAIELYRKESEAKSQSKELHESLIGQTEPADDSWTPKILIIFSLLLLIIFSMVKGDKEFHSIVGIEQCSSEYFGVIIGYFGIVLLQTAFTAVYISRKTSNSESKPHEFKLEGKVIYILPIVTFITGLLAGSLGIGGGLVLNPILIVYGMLPEVSTASCNVFVFMTSISSFIQFSMAGLIGAKEGFLLFTISVIGSCVGIFGIKKVMDKYKRASLLVFVLGGMLILVGTMIPINLILQIIKNIEEGTFTFALRSIC